MAMIGQQTYRSSRNGNGRELFERYMVPAVFVPWPADLLEVPALGLRERVLDGAYRPGFGSGWMSGSVASASSRHWALVATPWIRACASLHGSG